MYILRLNFDAVENVDDDDKNNAVDEGEDDEVDEYDDENVVYTITNTYTIHAS